MEKILLKNGVKLIYEYRKGSLTSFCIGFDAGALREENFNLGVAHALEHMLFKGTYTKTEKEINELCDKLFGFNNAMTNFPYAIYYGTSLSSDFNEAFSLYSDIILNAKLSEEGFQEEINVILQELKEWKEDFYQFCEDELLYNCFKNRRIKDIIIGTEESVKAITLEELKEYYKKYYCADNCVISVVTSLSKEEVVQRVQNNFKDLKSGSATRSKICYETNKLGIFTKGAKGLEGAKIQYCFDISFLSQEEIECLNAFSMFFGEGVSSVLYDYIRTKEGLAYDVFTKVKNEKGIKLFIINVSTSKDRVDRVLNIIDSKLNDLEKCIEEYYVSTDVLIKRLKLKRELSIERSIQLAKELCTYEIMYNNADILFKEIYEIQPMSWEIIKNTVYKILKNRTIQIIK